MRAVEFRGGANVADTIAILVDGHEDLEPSAIIRVSDAITIRGAIAVVIGGAPQPVSRFIEGPFAAILLWSTIAIRIAGGERYLTGLPSQPAS